MPGWLWVVLAVVLAFVIYLLLRGRGGSGRHRAPTAEYAPPLEDGAGRVDAETGFGPAATAGLAAPAAASVATEEEDRWAPRRTLDEAREETREEAKEEEREEELAEDAEARHDEGYVGTLDDPASTAKPEPEAAAEAEPAPAPEPEPKAAAEPEPEPEPKAAAEPEPDVEPETAAEPSDVTPSEYGPGSAAPGAGGAGPKGWTVKGNADSMLFYTDDAPGFRRAAADVWFADEEAATKAGFTRWDAHHR